MANQIDEMSRAIGRIEQKVDDLVSGFKILPCKAHDKKIEEYDSYKNRIIGMMAMLGVLSGFLGWLIAPMIDWLLTKIKL